MLVDLVREVDTTRFNCTGVLIAAGLHNRAQFSQLYGLHLLAKVGFHVLHHPSDVRQVEFIDELLFDQPVCLFFVLAKLARETYFTVLRIHCR